MDNLCLIYDISWIKLEFTPLTRSVIGLVITITTAIIVIAVGIIIIKKFIDKNK